VTTDNDSITLSQLLPNGNVVSPRLYLLSETQKEYEVVKLLGNEISFDIDVSKLPCGMNGALYLSEMNKTGGQNTLNPGGAAYGTGYCDAQCYTYPFINGVGNIQGKGACCHEMDLWEANAKATALTPHTCNHTGLYECTGAECSFNGVCDQWGCGYNPYAQGDESFYGPGLTVDTTKSFTVITQFPTDSTGKVLSEIRRLYIQDGKLIQNAAVNVSTFPALPAGLNYIDDAFCTATGGGSQFEPLGGITDMGAALHRGMVLIFTVWWDTGGFMNWLDSGSTGPCNATEGNPTFITQVQPDPAVTFSAIKWGEIGSTYSV